MLFGVRRREVLLLPPSGGDVDWVRSEIERPDILAALGFEQGEGEAALQLHASREMFLGLAHRQEEGTLERRRVGFALLFVPSPEQPMFEFVYAIPDPADRNAFTAIHTIDAMCFYAFEYVGVPGILYKVGGENRASRAIIRRLGFPPWRTLHDETGRSVTLSWLGRDRWVQRRLRLERGSEPAFLATMPDGIEPLRVPPPTCAEARPPVTSGP